MTEQFFECDLEHLKVGSCFMAIEDYAVGNANLGSSGFVIYRISYQLSFWCLKYKEMLVNFLLEGGVYSSVSMGSFDMVVEGYTVDLANLDYGVMQD